MSTKDNEDKPYETRSVGGGRSIVRYEFDFTAKDLVKPKNSWKATLENPDTITVWWMGEKYEVPFGTDVSAWREQKLKEQQDSLDEDFKRYKQDALKKYKKKKEEPNDEWIIGVSSFFTAIILLLFHINLWSIYSVSIFGGVSVILLILQMVSKRIEKQKS